MTRNSNQRLEQHSGFTLVELLVVILVILVLAAMFFPAMRRSGDAARRTDCSNRLRQAGIACHNFHDIHQRLPAMYSDEVFGTNFDAARQGKPSGLVALLPYLEEKKLYEQIKRTRFSNESLPLAELDPSQSPWLRVREFICPSSENDSTTGQTNYAFCIGDMARDIHRPTELRGSFAGQLTSRLDDFRDGTSRTILMGEMGTASESSIIGRFAVKQSASILDKPSDCFALLDENDFQNYKTNVVLNDVSCRNSWIESTNPHLLFNTILPPNSPSCAIDGSREVGGIFSASSNHSSGVNVVFADGSTQCISNSIDAGDPAQPTPTSKQIADRLPSQYGIWGALGTLNAEDKATIW